MMLYNSNLNNYDTGQWNFTVIQTGLLPNIVSRYTGYANDLSTNASITGRSIGWDTIAPTIPILISPTSGQVIAK